MVIVKWSFENKKEYLEKFFLNDSKNYLINRDSNIVKEIRNILLEKYPEHPDLENAILCELISVFEKFKHISFIRPDFSGGRNNIFTKKDKKLFINKENYKEKVIQTTLKIIELNNINYQNITYDRKMLPIENIEYFSEQLGLKKVEVASIFYKQGDIIFMNDNMMEVKKENLNDKNIDNILIAREKIAEVFNHETEDFNLFLLNDGTGTGKTFNGVHSFLNTYSNNTINNKRRNLVFIAPQKTQLFVEPNVYKKAREKNIPLLFARSQEDLINLNSKSFLNFNEKANSFESVRFFFDNLFNLFKNSEKQIDYYLKSKYLKKDFIENNEDESEFFDSNIDKNYSIPSFIELVKCYEIYRNFEKNNLYLKNLNTDRYEEELTKCKKIFKTVLIKVAHFLACNVDEQEILKIFSTNILYGDVLSFKKNIGSTINVPLLTYYLILYVLPFEASKYLNSIIFMTGQKSQTLLPLVCENKLSKNRIIKIFDLEHLVSGYYISKKADIVNHIINKTDFESFINNEYFIKDNDNYFYKNGISFSIIIDEEHEIYNEFIDKNTTKIITDPIFGAQVNIIHACAGISRWLENVKFDRDTDLNYTNKVIEDKIIIINRLINELNKHTILKTKQDVYSFFEFFLYNEIGMFIEENDFATLSNIFQNIVAYTPKIILRNKELADIKLQFIRGDSKIRINTNKHNLENKQQYNVLDFLQIILTCNYVFKESSILLKSFAYSEKDTNNQNNALYNFIQLSCESPRPKENNLKSKDLG